MADWDLQTVLPIALVTLAAVAFLVKTFVLDGPSGPVLDPKEFRKFKLTNKTEVSHNTAIYRFALPRASDVLGLPIGQHISIRAVINGKEVLRSYTPVADGKGWFDLLIKTYPQGNISQYVAGLKLGDSIEVRGPKGNFTYRPGLVKHLNMVAGGTGITPMLQIIQAIHANPSDKTTVNLIFGNVNFDDILLRDQLIEVAQDPRIGIHYILDNPPDKWDGSRGYVTRDLLTSELALPSPDSKLLICGPPRMVDSIKKAAVEIGWEKPRALSKLEDQVFAF